LEWRITRLGGVSFSFRRPTQDDLPAVIELVRGLWLDDGEDDDPTEFLTTLFRMLDLDRDVWLVEDEEGRVVAGGAVRARHPHRLRSFGGVLPEHRGQGIGTELRDRIEERARELAEDAPEGEEVWLGADAGVKNKSAKEFFEARGYELIRHFWTMGIDLDGETPEPDWPEGIRLERAQHGEERAVHAASEEAFADHWEHHPTPFELWKEWHAKSDSYDPSNWLLAKDGDEIAGISLLWIESNAGWVGILGVRPRWRRRGLGRALLLESFRVIRENGKQSARLGVDAANPTGATRLYENAGMQVVNESVAYRLIVR
jgi:mycothiol synthase